VDYDVKDLALADKGKRRILWADGNMPVLHAIRKRFEKEKPLMSSQDSLFCKTALKRERSNLNVKSYL